jgi:nucleotide-binding universal stress UspA family protein
VQTRLGYTIEDLGSTNGTLVNGEVLSEPLLLQPEDVIQIGTMVQMQYTATPQKFTTEMRTDVLPQPWTEVDTHVSAARRTTAHDVSDIALSGKAEPGPIGTGLEDVSLRDQVLVTYARENWEPMVASLVDALHEADIQAWVDQYLIAGSPDWQAATEQARLECWLLVVVVTQAALQSDLVRRNWRHFHNREKPIILLMVDGVDRLPIGANKLARIHYNPGLPDHAFRQLANVIDRLHNGP